jgi:cobalt/nickel transport system permease protein
MAHIHLEDGSFTLLWVIIWWALALVIIGSALYLVRRERKADTRRLTVAAFLVAAAFVLYQVDIPIAGGVHLSLTPLIAILAGPVIGALIVFVINILSAAVGHGGWGLIGANTLVNFSEVLVAYSVWRGLKPFLKNLFFRACAATLSGLILGNFVMMAVIAVSGIQGVSQSLQQVVTGLFLIASVNIAFAIIEAVMTGLIVSYIGRIRPDLLDE